MRSCLEKDIKSLQLHSRLQAAREQLSCPAHLQIPITLYHLLIIITLQSLLQRLMFTLLMKTEMTVVSMTKNQGLDWNLADHSQELGLLLQRILRLLNKQSDQFLHLPDDILVTCLLVFKRKKIILLSRNFFIY